MNNNRVILTGISLLMMGIPLVAGTNPPVTDRVITADFRQVQGPMNTMFKKVCRGRAGQRRLARRLAAATGLRASRMRF
jgi:hypothetical protein